jgi:hypothetical protein
MNKVRYYRSLLSIVARATVSQTILQHTVIALISISVPLSAYSIDCKVSGDIPFSVIKECEACSGGCLQCQGPWGRVSPLIDIDDLEHNKSCTFYAAADNTFSPWGRWTCIMYENTQGFCTTVLTPVLTMKDFCVEKSNGGGQEVTLKIKADQNDVPDFLEVDKPRPPCEPSVSSFLGDNPKQEKSRPDSDVFLFDGTGGDEVTLRLETDPQLGNNGGKASLAIIGNSLNESTSGALPLEIDATLPADGEYSITVEQPRRPNDQMFRGAYILHVESATGVDLIEPTNNVEN